MKSKAAGGAIPPPLCFCTYAAPDKARVGGYSWMMRALDRLRRIPAEVTVLTVLAVATRFWRLFDPAERAWDEWHFEEFASRYFSGSYYFDVHPPLGKLLFAFVAWAARVPASSFVNAASVPELRVLSALTGTLLIPTFWWLLRELGASRKVAAFGATLLLLDNALTVQSRFVLMDMMLLWFGVAAVTAFVAGRRRRGMARWLLIGCASLCAGAALSVKWTGLTALGLIGLVWLVDAWRARGEWARLVMEGAMLVAIPAVIYTGSFAVHFALLPNDGPGAELMAPEFAATLRGNRAYRADAHVPFVRKVADIHRVMLATNLGWSTIQHAAASKWYTWPISKHRILLWRNQSLVPFNVRRIDIQGNPVLWYGILVALGVFTAALALRRVRVGEHRGVLLMLAVAYAMNYVPFAFIKRPMFLYHYYFALVYSVAFVAIALGLLAGWQGDDDAPWRWRTRRAGALYAGLLGLVLASYLYFAPISYGLPLTAKAQAQRAWVLEGN